MLDFRIVFLIFIVGSMFLPSYVVDYADAMGNNPILGAYSQFDYPSPVPSEKIRVGVVLEKIKLDPNQYDFNSDAEVSILMDITHGVSSDDVHSVESQELYIESFYRTAWNQNPATSDQSYRGQAAVIAEGIDEVSINHLMYTHDECSPRSDVMLDFQVIEHDQNTPLSATAAILSIAGVVTPEPITTAAGIVGLVGSIASLNPDDNLGTGDVLIRGSDPSESQTITLSSDGTNHAIITYRVTEGVIPDPHDDCGMGNTPSTTVEPVDIDIQNAIQEEIEEERIDLYFQGSKSLIKKIQSAELESDEQETSLEDYETWKQHVIRQIGKSMDSKLEKQLESNISIMDIDKQRKMAVDYFNNGSFLKSINIYEKLFSEIHKNSEHNKIILDEYRDDNKKVVQYEDGTVSMQYANGTIFVQHNDERKIKFNASVDDAFYVMKKDGRIIERNVFDYDNKILPNWIKNNAKWWSDGQISDSEFATGIEFMVKNQIIPGYVSTSDDSTVSAKSNVNIPDWIKNNAKWWAQGEITEDDFLKGVDFMIDNKIIHISSVKQSKSIEDIKDPKSLKKLFAGLVWNHLYLKQALSLTNYNVQFMSELEDKLWQKHAENPSESLQKSARSVGTESEKAKELSQKIVGVLHEVRDAQEKTESAYLQQGFDETELIKEANEALVKLEEDYSVSNPDDYQKLVDKIHDTYKQVKINNGTFTLLEDNSTWIYEPPLHIQLERTPETITICHTVTRSDGCPSEEGLGPTDSEPHDGSDETENTQSTTTSETQVYVNEHSIDTSQVCSETLMITNFEISDENNQPVAGADVIVRMYSDRGLSQESSGTTSNDGTASVDFFINRNGHFEFEVYDIVGENISYNPDMNTEQRLLVGIECQAWQ